ncbi:MAG: response regulator [Smithellaceae bacterium]|nr:response regulator [Smithellaceae bacterium]
MTKKIMIVDDDELILIALKELLKPEGYEVHTTSSGFDALERLKRENFDLLLLDLIMPSMDGIELCRKIREQDELKHVPIIFLTAKSQEEDRAMGLAAGADFFLSKPISPEKLLKMLAVAIS